MYTKATLYKRKQAVNGFVKQYGNCLYHYTSFSALYGILYNKEMWFGNALTMNDKNEMTHFIDKMKKAILRNLSDQSAINRCESFFVQIHNIMEQKSTYIMCLSMLKDDAAQWERYADNAKGVCIEFDSYNLFTLIHYNLNCENMRLVHTPVFYDWNPQNHELYELLSKYFFTGTIPDEFYNEESLIENMIATSCSYKHKSFNNEKEVRIFSPWNTTKNPNVHFHIVGDTIKEYLHINIKSLCDEEEIPFEKLIRRIIVGPRSSQSIPVLRDFVKSCGLNNLADKISLSQCPLQ